MGIQMLHQIYLFNIFEKNESNFPGKRNLDITLLNIRGKDML